MKYSLKQIAEITGGSLIGNPAVQITSVIIDSRKPATGTSLLFVALKGENNDGHKYIEKVYSTHTKNFLVEKLPPDYEKKLPEANFIVVNNTLEALQKWAAYHRNKFTYPVIAITGSNGKTIVKEWLYQALREKYNIVRSPKSYNSQIGVPLSLFLMDGEHNLAIIEAGISKPDEMQVLQKIISPDIGIFTNIGDAHQENFPDLRSKVNEKLKLFTESQIIIYNRDYQLIEDSINSIEIFEDKKIFSWSTEFPSDLFVKNKRVEGDNTLFEVVYNGEVFSFECPFADAASFENVMNVISLMFYLGVDYSYIREKIKSLSPVAIRLEMKKAVNGCVLINDYYNSDINSISIALDFLHSQHKFDKKTLILSDVLQSGKDEYLLYKAIATLVNGKGVTKLIGIGSAIEKYKDLFVPEKYFFKTTDEFLSAIDEFVFSNEAILLKGARKFKFEKISKVLQRKTHETVLQINLTALANNLKFFRNKLPAGTKVMVMVKAFSYGNGNYEIANLLQYNNVDYLGVAFADEGIELRKANIYLPIMVMNPEPSAYEEIIEYNLEPEIYSFEVLEKFYEEVVRQRIVEYPVHIKINTGMNRLGFEPTEIERLAGVLKNMPELRVKSVFSHLAAADDPSDDEFTIAQLELFGKVSANLEALLGAKLIKHILNTHGILRFPGYAFDMVRLGIGLYGFAEVEWNKLENVSTLVTKVLQVKTIEPPATVGYNRKGKITGKTEVAIIPIGYAHGYDRRFGNGTGKMIVKGKLVPTIGNINMDMTAIDVTGLDVKPGDEVVVFGKDYSAADLAKSIGTIPYEIITAISPRVKRIYYYE